MRTAATFALITAAARASDSTSSTRAAPRDSASSPTAPDPAYRSSTRRFLRSPNSETSEEKSPSRARSLVGRVPCPDGTRSLRPPAFPAMTRVTGPVCHLGLVEELGAAVAEEVVDRLLERLVGGQR